MAEVVSPLVKLAIEALMSELIKEVRMVWEVDDDLKTLSKTLKKIQCVLTDAEEAQVTKAAVKDWLSELKDIAYDADDVLDELQYEAFRQLEEGDQTDEGRGKLVHNSFLNCFCFRPKPILSRRDVAKRIKSINDRLATVSSDREKFCFREDDGAGRKIKPETERPPTSSVPLENKSGFLGREKDKKKIIELLLSDDTCGSHQTYCVISIVGMGGLGKTALAQHVYNDEGVKAHFEVRAWACVSENFDVLKITKDIIESVERKCDISAIDPMQCKLKEILTNKRFLIVLDDVWNKERGPWDMLQGPFNAGARGSKVLVTTRGEDVSRAVCTVHLYQMEPLAKDDCVSLLLQHAFAGERHGADPELMKIGEELVERHCRGLPLAAKVLGSLLYEKKESDFWKSILNNQLWISKDYEVDEVMKAMRVSYYHLSPHIKQCFAFCSIFPKDYEFDKDELVRLWMAQGFIKSAESMRLEERGGQFFDQLMQRSFFQRNESGSGNFKMHDCIHDLAMSVSSEECLLVDQNATNPTPDRLRHLSLFEVDTDGRVEELGASNRCNGLRTICWVGKISESVRLEIKCQQAINNLIGNFKCLRVLIWKYSEIDKLLNSISNLKHLRYLNVANKWIKELPASVSSLYHLQTLDLQGCTDLCSLSEEIGKLKNLRYLCLSGVEIERLPESVSGLQSLETLDLSYCKKLCLLPEKIGELKNLRRFDLTCTKINQLPESVIGLHSLETLNLWGCENLCLLPEKTGELKKLRSFVLSQTKIERLPESVSGLRSLETLDLRDCVNLCLLPEKTGDLKKLRCLVLSQTKIERLPESVSGLHSLEILDLIDCKNLCLLLESMCGLQSLKTLDLRGCDNLCSLPESVSGLHSLETLNLSYCQNLCSLPKSVSGLDSVETLDLSYCQSLCSLPESVSGLDSLERLNLRGCWNLCSLPESVSGLHSLERLNLRGCWNLCSLPESMSGLHSLKTLDLRGCWNLCSLPESMSGLHSLKTLDLSNCQNLCSLPESVSGLHSLETLDLSNCQNLCSLLESVSGLHSLETLVLSYCENLCSLPESVSGLHSLKTLDLHDCENLCSLPESVSSLHSLETLDLSGCLNFCSLPESVSCLKSLKTLDLRGCQSLCSLPESVSGLHSLETLDLSYCQNLCSLPESVSGLHSLETLDLSGCRNLCSLPESVSGLKSLETLDLCGCENLCSLPESVSGLNSLKTLVLSGCQNLCSLLESVSGLCRRGSTLKHFQCRRG